VKAWKGLSLQAEIWSGFPKNKTSGWPMPWLFNHLNRYMNLPNLCQSGVYGRRATPGLVKPPSRSQPFVRLLLD